MKSHIWRSDIAGRLSRCIQLTPLPSQPGHGSSRLMPVGSFILGRSRTPVPPQMHVLAVKWNARQQRGVPSNVVALPLLHRLHAPSSSEHPARLLQPKPAYETPFGAMVCDDAATAMAALPSESVDLIVTSPPYALHFKKEY